MAELPGCVVIENVPGFLSANEGRDFANVKDKLAGLGYCVKHICIDAAAFVAQSRLRVFMLGFKDCEPDYLPSPPQPRRDMSLRTIAVDDDDVEWWGAHRLGAFRSSSDTSCRCQWIGCPLDGREGVRNAARCRGVDVGVRLAEAGHVRIRRCRVRSSDRVAREQLHPSPQCQPDASIHHQMSEALYGGLAEAMNTIGGRANRTKTTRCRPATSRSSREGGRSPRSSSTKMQKGIRNTAKASPRDKSGLKIFPRAEDWSNNLRSDLGCP